MKKLLKSFGIIAMAAIIVFGMAACGGNDDEQPLFSVSGEFKSAVAGTAKFQAKTDETAARSTGVTYELSGELEDGDLLLKLRGSFDPSDDSYTVSAAASFLRYTVTGNPGGATATVAIKDNNDVWTTHIVSVTIKEVNVKKGNGAEETGGIPEFAWGAWNFFWAQPGTENTKNTNSYFTQWFYNSWESTYWDGNWSNTSTQYTVVESKEVTGESGKYDIIFTYPIYDVPDETKKTAAKAFLDSIGLTGSEFWPHRNAPWETEAFFGPYEGDALDFDNTIWWYICDDANHAHYGDIIWIDWNKFTSIMIEKELGHFEGDDFKTELWDAQWDTENWGDFPSGENKSAFSTQFWNRRDRIGTWFKDNGIGVTPVTTATTTPQARYYFGYHRADVDKVEGSVYHDNSTSRCAYWEPSENWETFWGKTRYYIQWNGDVNFQADWDNNRSKLEKWWGDEYLFKNYVDGKITPKTWYSRARLWLDNGELRIQFYPGDDDAVNSGTHWAPSGNSQNLEKVENLVFDPDYWEYSGHYTRQ